MMDSKAIVLKPHMSEKAYTMSQANDVYVFLVPMAVNVHTVAEAVSAQFKVTVKNVRMVIIKGKSVKVYRKRGGSTSGKRSDVKKAYVTLIKGDSIPIFAAIEKAENAEGKKK